MKIKYSVFDHHRVYDESSMGHPHAIAPLIAAALVQGGFALAQGAYSHFSQESANEKNIAAANKANAIQNQQWGAEMKESKRKFDVETALSVKNNLENMLSGVPLVLRKNLVDTWSGGK